MAVANFVDPELGEVKSETGIGHVVEFTHETGKRNAYVKIKADGLQHPLGGWIDTHTAPREFMDVAAVSLGEGRRVRYRIDVHAKNGVEVNGRKLDQLDKSERVRDLVGLELFAGTDAVHNGTSGAQKPASGDAAPEATTGAPAPSGPAAPSAGADPGEIPPPSDDDAPAGAAAPRRGPKVQEAKPWEEDNTDGSPNLGSYAVIAAVSTVELAWELLVARHEPGTQPPTVAQARALGRRLLFVADRVQAAVRPDHRIDRMDNSHTRARGAMRSALEFHRPPFGGEPPDVAKWMDDLTTTATELFTAGLGLLMEFEK